MKHHLLTLSVITLRNKNTGYFNFTDGEIFLQSLLWDSRAGTYRKVFFPVRRVFTHCHSGMALSGYADNGETLLGQIGTISLNINESH